MSYKLSPDADTSGTSLRKQLIRLRESEVRSRFGNPQQDLSCGEGYGPEWIFTDPAGRVFTLYTRWGIFRIGSMQEEVADFALWLEAELASASADLPAQHLEKMRG